MIGRTAPSDREAPRVRTAGRGTPPIVVRPATPRDLPVVVELRLALLREHERNPLYEQLRVDAPARARRLFAAQLRSPDEILFLAERGGGGGGGGEVVGILRCVQTDGLPMLLPARYAYISSVYVVPAARRQGVLRSLFTAALDWCRARGITEIRLHNAVENAAANAAWEALGFQVVEYLRMRRLSG